MQSVAYLINNNNQITVYLKGTPYVVKKDESPAKYKKVIDLLNSGAPVSESETVLSTKIAIQNWVGDNIRFVDGVFYYGTHILDTRLTRRIIELARQSAPVIGFLKFLDRIARNPSSRAANEAFEFLENKYMPITMEGTVLGYKGVGEDGWSIRGNQNTRVLQGTVNQEGQILNQDGDVIEVVRQDVDDDRNRTCSWGLHIGSLDYAKSWGPRVKIVEFAPEDIVSVPADGGKKLRVCKYTVIEDYTEPLPEGLAPRVQYTEEEMQTLQREVVSLLTGDDLFCCFCGNRLPLLDPEYLSLYRTASGDLKSRGIYCSHCGTLNR